MRSKAKNRRRLKRRIIAMDAEIRLLREALDRSVSETIRLEFAVRGSMAEINGQLENTGNQEP